MTDLRKAAEMALEALDSDNPDIQLRAAIALRQALAQPEQEPVECMCGLCKLGKREWVGLTDEEIAEGQASSWVDKQAFESAVWWAEKKLKEKNV